MLACVSKSLKAELTLEVSPNLEFLCCFALYFGGLIMIANQQNNISLLHISSETHFTFSILQKRIEFHIIYPLPSLRQVHN